MATTAKNKPGAKTDAKNAPSTAMQLTPNDTELLVGNSYTATLQLSDDVDPETGDIVTFIHPNGWDVKASVTGKVASGTFLIERERQFDFGFKVNGKKVASASYATRTA